jgi:hypothetical protein
MVCDVPKGGFPPAHISSFDRRLVSPPCQPALSARLHQARLTSRCNSGVDMQAIIPFCSHCKGLISYPEDEEHAFNPIKSSAV